MTPDRPPLYLLKHRYLAPWLDTAMKRLTTEARARIREEIETHFEEALAENINAGFSDDTAARRAVHDLGSARASGRAFRRSYLTTWEALNIRPFRTTGISYAFGFLGLFTLAFVLLLPPRHPWEWFCMFSSALAAIAQGPLVHVAHRRGNERRAVLVGVSMNFAFWFFYIARDMVEHPISVALFAPFFAVWIFTYARAFPKLEQHFRSQA